MNTSSFCFPAFTLRSHLLFHSISFIHEELTTNKKVLLSVQFQTTCLQTSEMSSYVFVSWDRSTCLVSDQTFREETREFLWKKDKNSLGSFRYHAVLLLLLFSQGITRRLLCSPRSHTVVEFVSSHRKIKWRVCVWEREEGMINS